MPDLFLYPFELYLCLLIVCTLLSLISYHKTNPCIIALCGLPFFISIVLFSLSIISPLFLCFFFLYCSPAPFQQCEQGKKLKRIHWVANIGRALTFLEGRKVRVHCRLFMFFFPSLFSPCAVLSTQLLPCGCKHRILTLLDPFPLPPPPPISTLSPHTPHLTKNQYSLLWCIFVDFVYILSLRK